MTRDEALTRAAVCVVNPKAGMNDRPRSESEIISLIADALLAADRAATERERERCELIALRRRDKYKGVEKSAAEGVTHAFVACDAIAAAIRSGEKG